MYRNTNKGLLLLRIAIGGFMLLHGIAKLQYGIDFIKGYLLEKKISEYIAYGVYIGEVIAPIFIVLGFRTRLAALIYAINCLIAMFLVHSNTFFSLNNHGGWALELLGLYLFGALTLFYTGAGRIALSKRNKWD